MSGIVELPKSWVLTTLDEVCNFHVGVGFPTEMQGSSGHELPFYKVKDVSVAWLAQSSFLLDTEHSLSREDAGRIKAKPVPAGTVVFAKIGEALRLNRRAIAARPSLIDNNLMGIEAPPTRLAQRFLYWFTLTTKFDVDARASVVPSIRKSDVSNLSFPLPPLNEQTRIVEKLEELLSDLDAGVAELKAAQKKLAQYRQSLLKAAVEGALTAEWRQKHPPAETGAQLLQRILAERRERWEAKQLAKFKEQGKTPPKDWQKKYPEPVQPDASGLPALPPGWVWASVEQLAELSSGNTPKDANQFSESNGSVPWFKVGDMNLPGNEEWMRSATTAFSRPIADSLGLKVMPVGTIIFPKRGGAIATNKKRRLGVEGCYDLNTMGLVPVQSVSDWLWAWFLGVDLGRLADGSNVPQINNPDIAPLRVPLPPLGERRVILLNLKLQFDAVTNQQLAVEHSLKQSTAQRQNILRAAFAGQLMPQDPADEPASVLLERIRAERAVAKQAKPTRKGRGRSAEEVR